MVERDLRRHPPPPNRVLDRDLGCSEQLTVCDLTGAERFVVWAVRWCASVHDDADFADLCLRDSFERAGITGCLQADRFGDAWRTLAAVCSRVEAARAMLALGEVADELSRLQARVRPWHA